MTRSLRGIAGWTAVGLAVLSAPAFASVAQFEIPDVTVVGQDRTSITLRLTAGPSGAPAGIYVEWMKKADFDVLGWLYDPYDARLVYCDFNPEYGAPSWHTSPAGTYALGPGESVDVVIGKLFDETGLSTDFLDELSANEQVVFHALTNGSGTTGPSDYSLDLFTASGAQGSNCTFTVGYWKTHGSGACHNGSNADTWPVASLTLGTVVYTKDELCAILNTQANGNALLILAHQLIAAKLNLAQGADGSCVSATIAHADGLIGGLIVPPTAGGSNIPANSVLGQQMVADANVLDTYNNGALCDPHCGTPTKRSTWGAIKTLYR